MSFCEKNVTRSRKRPKFLNIFKEVMSCGEQNYYSVGIRRFSAASKLGASRDQPLIKSDLFRHVLFGISEVHAEAEEYAVRAFSSTVIGENAPIKMRKAIWSLRLPRFTAIRSLA